MYSVLVAVIKDQYECQSCHDPSDTVRYYQTYKSTKEHPPPQVSIEKHDY